MTKRDYLFKELSRTDTIGTKLFMKMPDHFEIEVWGIPAANFKARKEWINEFFNIDLIHGNGSGFRVVTFDTITTHSQIVPDTYLPHKESLLKEFLREDISNIKLFMKSASYPEVEEWTIPHGNFDTRMDWIRTNFNEKLKSVVASSDYSIVSYAVTVVKSNNYKIGDNTIVFN